MLFSLHPQEFTLLHPYRKKKNSVFVKILDARCLMECPATEALRESNVLLLDDQLKGQRLCAAFVSCMKQTQSARISVCPGQSDSFGKSNFGYFSVSNNIGQEE